MCGRERASERERVLKLVGCVAVHNYTKIVGTTPMYEVRGTRYTGTTKDTIACALDKIGQASIDDSHSLTWVRRTHRVSRSTHFDPHTVVLLAELDSSESDIDSESHPFVSFAYKIDVRDNQPS